MKIVLTPPSDYTNWQARLVQLILDAQQAAASSVDREAVLLYWKIGCAINVRLEAHGWGPLVIDWLSSGLSEAFPGCDEWSRENLKFMSDFAREWTERSALDEVAVELPWQFHLVLLQDLNQQINREWYARKSIECNWPIEELKSQIAAKVHLNPDKAGVGAP